MVPTHLKIFLSGKVHEDHGTKGGQYVLQSNSITTEFHYWISKDETKAIWWHVDLKNWVVGDAFNIGQNVGSIFGPKKIDDLPHEIIDGWRFSASNCITKADVNEIIVRDWSTNVESNILPLEMYGLLIMVYNLSRYSSTKKAEVEAFQPDKEAPRKCWWSLLFEARFDQWIPTLDQQRWIACHMVAKRIGQMDNWQFTKSWEEHWLNFWTCWRR